MKANVLTVLERMSDGKQTVIKTKSGNDTFVNKFSQITWGVYNSLVLNGSYTDTAVMSAFKGRAGDLPYLYVTTYAVRDSDASEYVSQPMQYPNGTAWKNVQSDAFNKKTTAWHMLSIYEYMFLKYNHYIEKGEAYKGTSYDYSLNADKTVLVAKTGYSDVEMNLTNTVSGVHLHEYAKLPVAGIRIVNGVLQVKGTDASDKYAEDWDKSTGGWMWMNGSTGGWYYIDQIAVNDADALHIANTSQGSYTYQLSQDLVSVGSGVIGDVALNELKKYQLYPNVLNPLLNRINVGGVSATYYAIFHSDCKQISFNQLATWGGDENTACLMAMNSN